MPRQNKTGPFGMGSKTGRGMGSCGGTSHESFSSNEQTCRGFGRGLGLCRNENMPMNRNLELLQKEQLAEQKEILQARLAEVTAQLEKL